MIRNYDKLIFELSKEGRVGYSLPKKQVEGGCAFLDFAHLSLEVFFLFFL